MKDCFWPWSHDWTKWEQFDLHSKIIQWMPQMDKKIEADDYTPMQKRHCLKCGKEQREEI